MEPITTRRGAVPAAEWWQLGAAERRRACPCGPAESASLQVVEPFLHRDRDHADAWRDLHDGSRHHVVAERGVERLRRDGGLHAQADEASSARLPFDLRDDGPANAGARRGPPVNAMGQVSLLGNVSNAELNAALRPLGLRLEAARAPIEVLVVDSVERPSEN